MTARFNCIVDRVADTQYPCYAPHPDDPNNTVDTGLKVQVLTLEVIPDKMQGGKGHADIWLFDYLQIGRFKPGQRVQVDITVEDSI